MQPAFPLRNPIRDYAWGSRRAIADLLGEPPADEPQAELWLGAHPSASSEVLVEVDGGVGSEAKNSAPLQGAWHRLDDWIRSHRGEILGPEVAGRWGHLPFLMKVLAAARPLSIQAHPDADQARAGFAAEEAAGVPRDAAERNYPDDRHKPEIIYALTDFTVLRGFRRPADIARRLDRVGLGGSALAAAVSDFADDSALDVETGLRRLLDAFLSLDGDDATRLVGSALAEVARRGAADDAESWLPRLAEEYGRDRGVLAPLFLHVRRLQPGEALYTGAGVLHAYLEGLGIEVMASSDNVLRGALTAKHVDPAELAKVVRYEAGAPELAERIERRSKGAAEDATEEVFLTPAPEFRLSVLRPRGGDVELPGGVQILLCTDGEGTMRFADRELSYRRGQSFLVPHATGSYAVSGHGTLFRASVFRAAVSRDGFSG